MSVQSPKAFFMSATLHAAAVVVLLLFTYWSNRQVEVPQIFELVAGEGDNFAAKEAPARTLDSPVKIDLPPLPEPVTPEPAAPEPVTVTPAPPPPPQPAPPPPQATPAPPHPKATTPPPPKKAPDFAKQIRREVILAESRAKQQAARQRAAEARRLAAEKKAQEKKKQDELKAKAAQAKSKPAPTPAPKIAKIDTDGLVKSVLGGAGGKALSTDNEDVLGAYFAMFKQRVRAEFEAPPGLSDAVGGEFEFRIHPDGSISHARVVKSSTSSEFDRAVLEAIRRVRMPAHPSKRTETVQFQFTMRDRDTG